MDIQQKMVLGALGVSGTLSMCGFLSSSNAEEDLFRRIDEQEASITAIRSMSGDVSRMERDLQTMRDQLRRRVSNNSGNNVSSFTLGATIATGLMYFGGDLLQFPSGPKWK